MLDMTLNPPGRQSGVAIPKRGSRGDSGIGVRGTAATRATGATGATKAFVATLALALCVATAGSAFAGPAERVANAMTSCAWSDKLAAGPITKLPEAFKLRAVQLPGGAAQVSIVEGFRFPIAAEGKDIFANVKVEQSEAERFEADREAIVANLRWILSTSKDMESPEPLLVSMNGYEGPMINRGTLTGSTLALIALFQDKEKLIVTIYLENAAPEKRSFSTKEEWNGMRDRLFVALTGCASKALAP